MIELSKLFYCRSYNIILKETHRKSISGNNEGSLANVQMLILKGADSIYQAWTLHPRKDMKSAAGYHQ